MVPAAATAARTRRTGRVRSQRSQASTELASAVSEATSSRATSAPAVSAPSPPTERPASGDELGLRGVVLEDAEGVLEPGEVAQHPAQRPLRVEALELRCEVAEPLEPLAQPVPLGELARLQRSAAPPADTSDVMDEQVVDDVARRVEPTRTWLGSADHLNRRQRTPPPHQDPSDVAVQRGHQRVVRRGAASFELPAQRVGPGGRDGSQPVDERRQRSERHIQVTHRRREPGELPHECVEELRLFGGQDLGAGGQHRACAAQRDAQLVELLRVERPSHPRFVGGEPLEQVAEHQREHPSGRLLTVRRREPPGSADRPLPRFRRSPPRRARSWRESSSTAVRAG